MDFLKQMIDETIKTGIGQAIIAFGAWAYVPVLLLVVVYNVIICIISGIKSRSR